MIGVFFVAVIVSFSLLSFSIPSKGGCTVNYPVPSRAVVLFTKACNVRVCFFGCFPRTDGETELTRVFFGFIQTENVIGH